MSWSNTWTLWQKTDRVTPCVGLLLPLPLIRRPLPHNNGPSLLPSVSLSGFINLLPLPLISPPAHPPSSLPSFPLLHSILVPPCACPPPSPTLPSFSSSPLLLLFLLSPSNCHLCVLLTSSLEVLRSWLTYFSERRRHTYNLISITSRQAWKQQMLRESY